MDPPDIKNGVPAPREITEATSGFPLRRLLPERVVGAFEYVKANGKHSMRIIVVAALVASYIFKGWFPDIVGAFGKLSKFYQIWFADQPNRDQWHSLVFTICVPWCIFWVIVTVFLFIYWKSQATILKADLRSQAAGLEATWKSKNVGLETELNEIKAERDNLKQLVDRYNAHKGPLDQVLALAERLKKSGI